MYTELHDPCHATENCQIKPLSVLVLLDIDKSGLLQMLSLTGILLSYVNIIKQIWSGQKEKRANVISPSSYLASGDPLAKAISISSIKVLGFP